jgi:antirestriction protein ArdC
LGVVKIHFLVWPGCLSEDSYHLLTDSARPPATATGAAYLCAEAGISNAVIENQAAYLAGWLGKLRDDRKLLIYAAAQAQKAADFILNRSNVEN